MPKLPQPDTNIQKQKQRKRKTVQENIDPGRPISRPQAPESTNTNWGKTLTKKELLGLVDRIYKKQEEDKMSKLSETLKKALAKKQGKPVILDGEGKMLDISATGQIKQIKAASPGGKKPPTRSAGRGR